MPPKAVKTRNLTQGGQFLAEHRYREVETILDELRRAGEHIGLAVRTMEIEMGASQFEFTFEPSDPMTQADRFVLFRTMVKEISSQKGFMQASWPNRDWPMRRQTVGICINRSLRLGQARIASRRLRVMS